MWCASLVKVFVNCVDAFIPLLTTRVHMACIIWEQNFIIFPGQAALFPHGFQVIVNDNFEPIILTSISKWNFSLICLTLSSSCFLCHPATCCRTFAVILAWSYIFGWCSSSGMSWICSGLTTASNLGFLAFTGVLKLLWLNFFSLAVFFSFLMASIKLYMTLWWPGKNLNWLLVPKPCWNRVSPLYCSVINCLISLIPLSLSISARYHTQ